MNGTLQKRCTCKILHLVGQFICAFKSHWKVKVGHSFRQPCKVWRKKLIRNAWSPFKVRQYLAIILFSACLIFIWWCRRDQECAHQIEHNVQKVHFSPTTAALRLRSAGTIKIELVFAHGISDASLVFKTGLLLNEFFNWAERINRVGFKLRFNKWYDLLQIAAQSNRFKLAFKTMAAFKETIFDCNKSWFSTPPVYLLCILE